MKALTLTDLESFLDSPSLGNCCTLAAGVYEVTRTIAVKRRNIRIEGECQGIQKKTILKRGRTDDGSLFTGPLIQGKGVSDVVITSLIINGMRFADSHDGTVDLRHPLGVAPDSPLFCCGRVLSPPDAFVQSNFSTPFEADLFFSDTRRLSVQNLDLHNPIKFGIALGNGTHEVNVEDLYICRGGDGGVWCGLILAEACTSLPLPKAIEQQRPRNILFRNCTFEGCGAAGLFLEASHVTIESCVFRGNHRDFPYNCDGGQIEIDYKSDFIVIDSCSVLEGPSLLRDIATWLSDAKRTDLQQRLLRVVGIEACGSSLLFKDNRIEGHSHEGIHLNGARQVRICGNRTVIGGNHSAWPQYSEIRHEPRQNISVTTTAELKKRNAIAEHICIEEIRCENGIIFWSDGSEPALNIDNVTVRDSDLRGTPGSGIVVCNNLDGTSVRGANWSLSGNVVDEYNSRR
jgi:hypothetical protein